MFVRLVMSLVIEDHQGASNGDLYAISKSVKKPRHLPLDHVCRCIVSPKTGFYAQKFGGGGGEHGRS